MSRKLVMNNKLLVCTFFFALLQFLDDNLHDDVQAQEFSWLKVQSSYACKNTMNEEICFFKYVCKAQINIDSSKSSVSKMKEIRLRVRDTEKFTLPFD